MIFFVGRIIIFCKLTHLGLRKELSPLFDDRQAGKKLIERIKEEITERLNKEVVKQPASTEVEQQTTKQPEQQLQTTATIAVTDP